MRISLRLKLALISLLLLAIPYTGVRLAAIVQTSLLESRKEALMFSARAVAQALSGRQGLFDRERFHSLDRQRDLYILQLSSPMRLNGKVDDWQPHLNNALVFGRDHVLDSSEEFKEGDAGFRYLSGIREGYLYALFVVDDDTQVFRDKNSLALDRSDHLQIAVEDGDGNLNRYLIAATEPGWVNGYHTSRDFDTILPARLESRIQGVWETTASGYILEIRIPLVLVGRRLAFAIADVDNQRRREIETVIGTASINHPDKIGWLLPPSDDIEDILAALNRPQSKIQVVDSNRHVRASYGSLVLEQDNNGQFPNQNRVLRQVNRLLSLIYSLFTEPLSTSFDDPGPQPSPLDLHGIEEALGGASSITSYRIADGEVEIMAAVTPLYENNAIVGAVVVEQTTNSILALKNRVIEESLGLTLLLLLFGGFGLLLFAFRISSRIRQLRDQASSAIGENGTIEVLSPPSAAGDEIGDLSRTLHSMLSQLREQVHYREKMADNLEHEMRTPLASASASLKNLVEEMEEQPQHIHDYVTWALRDIGRMEDLLTAIRDATSLKNALGRGDKEPFNLSEAIGVWLDFSWRTSFKPVLFSYNREDTDIIVEGDPDRIRQMLDKVIENAVAFHRPGTEIEIGLVQMREKLQLTIVNQGPAIAENMLEEIFSSMVSVRSSGDSRPHLGLGLYIVRTIAEYHGGRVSAENLKGETTGVRFVIDLPQAADTTIL